MAEITVWGKLKAILKRYTITLFLGRKVKHIWNRHEHILLLIKYVVHTIFKKAVLINSPLYRNLGDQAIAVAELECLERLKISCCDFPWTHEAPESFAKITASNKLILFQGGGNLGQLWPREEKRFRETVKAFKNNPIIVFPQTIYFDLNSVEGCNCFEESKAIYESHPNLLVFVRENSSLSFMRKHMPNVHVCLAPDMVMALQWHNPNVKRDGAVICIRGDKERVLSEADYTSMLEIIGTYYNNLLITDTVSPGDMPIDERQSVLEKKLFEFSSASLVVTDRLHGMIFAAITETPCIVVDSLSPKIRGCYDWLSDLGYIRFMENLEEIPEIIESLKSIKPKFSCEKIEEAMRPLYKALIEASK